MKDKIIEYIKKQEIEFCEYTADNNKIFIDYSYNPVRAVILNSLIEKHFKILSWRAVLRSLVVIYVE